MRTQLAIALFLVAALLIPAAPADAAGCRFTLGFQALHDRIPSEVGASVENEHFNTTNGNAEQQTTAWHGKGGLLVWRKADNWTALTDGATTWINGPYGVQTRPNGGPLFSWERTAPAPPPPSDGTNLLTPRCTGGLGAGGNKLIVVNQTGSDAVVRLVDAQGQTCRLVYVRSQATLQDVMAGGYRLQYALGSQYDSASRRFLSSAGYYESPNALPFQPRPEIDTWTVTLVWSSNPDTRTRPAQISEPPGFWG